VRIGAIQLNATDDLDRNLSTADRLVRDAAGRGATLVVLPEKWTVLGTPAQLRHGAEPLDGRALMWASQTAKELGIDLIAGSIVEHVDGDEKTANTSVHFAPDGERRAVYRKLHMFDVEVDGTVYAESANERPGSEIVATTLGDGTVLGMTICYDLRFPELYRALAAEHGAEVLAVPAAFTLATTRDHWEVLVRARAIEDQCFVVAANQIGDHPGGYRSGGRSLIVDPWGLVLASAADSECAIVADADLERLREIRGRLPSLANRRADVYGRQGG
jgi:predicted amidohydrolase